MRIIEYSPISATRYITLEEHGSYYRVCDWTLHGTGYQCRLIGGTPTTKSRGYYVLGKAYKRYRRHLARLAVPTVYEIAKLPLLGLLQITGWAKHPIMDIGEDMLFFTLADGTLGLCKIRKII